jgi:ribonuclease VapC
MILDSSAVLAIVLGEPGFKVFVDAIAEAPNCRISAAAFVEASIVAESRIGDQGIRQCRHADGLNFGDCFSYALAKSTGEPLLFKGTDFGQTDIQSALP